MSAQILLVDDGELDDVARILDGLGEPFERLRGGAIPEAVEPPERLFVATPRRAALAERWRRRSGGPLLLCISAEDSNALRDQLRRQRFDLLVRRPLHPAALRLVITGALYTGRERRDEARAVVGREADVRVGTRVERMVLVDLSAGGGLLLGPRLAVGRRVTLHVPPDLTCGESLALRAKVIRSRGGLEGGHEMAIAIDEPSAVLRERLESAVTVLRAREQDAADATLPGSGTASDVDRRKHRRGAFEGEARMVDRSQKSLLGRDLSVGGMRVLSDVPLHVGEGLRLALYAEAEAEPFLIDAVVVRDDGDAGRALRFENVTADVAARIEAVVARLPAVEALQQGEAAGLGAVVSEILERDGLEEDPEPRG